MTEPRRTFVVTVKEYCDHCATLKEDVAQHDHNNYWPSWAVSMKSCADCFAEAKRKAADSAYAGSVCC